MERSDADLLDAIRRGDQQAVDALLGRYEPTIYRFGLRMCGNEQERTRGSTGDPDRGVPPPTYVPR
jgi:DNA-directed RNA polymerase specialized sigma24 family protein